jgi:hypothetical protein
MYSVCSADWGYLYLRVDLSISDLMHFPFALFRKWQQLSATVFCLFDFVETLFLESDGKLENIDKFTSQRVILEFD